MKHRSLRRPILFVMVLFGAGLAMALAGFTPQIPAQAAETAESDELRFPDEPPKEPDGYKLDKYRSIVPTSLKGAIVVSDKEAMALHESGEVVFIDVMPFVPRPPNLPEGMIWRDKKRSNIPHSMWLANVGYGRLPPEMDEYFRRHLAKVTGAETKTPVLFYCQKDCWMSWNAAKRALEYGYERIYWYPDGTDGWASIGGELEAATPLPLPNMTRPLNN